MGIRLERIEPGKPQQNGRHERMHLTLKQDNVPADSLAAQQRAFDLWRREFNEERPHEALGQKPPATVYGRSRRGYPRKLIRPSPASWSEIATVDREGFIRRQRREIFVSTALAHEPIELDSVGTPNEQIMEVRYGSIVLGRLHTDNLQRGLILPTRKRRGNRGKTGNEPGREYCL